MIGFDQALALIAANAAPTTSEIVPLGRAHGRTLAAAVEAMVRSPPFDASVMDGYAVRETDLARLPAALRIVGESFAGAPFNRPIDAGECVRIFTGAAVPEEADRIVMQEMVERSGDEARFELPLAAQRYIRRAGSDFACGDTMVEAGTVLGSRAIVATAAADIAELRVWKRPRVSILVTGDELVEPGTARVTPGAIPDSISIGIGALARDWGAEVVRSAVLPDRLDQMERTAAGALADCDLIVVTGGASVGEKDFAKAMFAPAGLELTYSGLAIKPGRPAWLGRAGKRLVIGLPGNPTSALVTGRLLLAPLLASLSGRPIDVALSWRPARLANPLDECGERETFHRARWTNGSVEILSNQESSAQKVLAEAQLLVRQRANSGAVDAGALVETLDF